MFIVSFFSIMKLTLPPVCFLLFVHSDNIFSASFAVVHSSFSASFCSISFISGVVLSVITAVFLLSIFFSPSFTMYTFILDMSRITLYTLYTLSFVG